MDSREELLEQLEAILFEVQYAKLGMKSYARKKAAREIADTIEAAYKFHLKSRKTATPKATKEEEG